MVPVVPVVPVVSVVPGGAGGPAVPVVSVVPVVLWNARLEDDKDPSTFIAALLAAQAAPDAIPFELVVLGTDPTKGSRWYVPFPVVLPSLGLLHTSLFFGGASAHLICTDRCIPDLC